MLELAIREFGKLFNSPHSPTNNMSKTARPLYPNSDELGEEEAAICQGALAVFGEFLGRERVLTLITVHKVAVSYRRAVSRMVNERANGSETGTRVENRTMTEHANGSESEIGIKNETMTERTNRSGSKNGTMNGSANKNRSASQTEYMSSKTSKDGSMSGVLNQKV
jgi:hypothetical protein